MLQQFHREPIISRLGGVLISFVAMLKSITVKPPEKALNYYYNINPYHWLVVGEYDHSLASGRPLFGEQTDLPTDKSIMFGGSISPSGAVTGNYQLPQHQSSEPIELHTGDGIHIGWHTMDNGDKRKESSLYRHPLQMLRRRWV